MKKGGMSLTIAGTMMMILVGVFSANSQEDIKFLADEAFEKLQRPAAVYPHDEHNEKAEIDECNVCHHLYENGKKVEDESSEDMGCSECHKLKREDNKLPLMKAFHESCKGCHLKSKKNRNKTGPITCGECHVRK